MCTREIPRAGARGAVAFPATVLMLALLLSSCAGLPAGGPGAPESAFDREARRVRAAVETLIEADNRGDLEGVTGCYAQNIALIPPTGLAITGRAAVRSHYQALFERYRFSLRVQIAESMVVRDAATVRGRTTGRRTPLASGEAVAIDDDFVAELVLEDDGRWRIERLSWTPHR